MTAIEKDSFYKALQERRRSAIDFGELEGYCLYSHFNTDSLDNVAFAQEFVLDGSLFVLLSRGCVALRQNHNLFEMKGPSFLVLQPGTTISVGAIDSVEAEMHILYFTRPFLQGLNLTLGVMSGHDVTLRDRPEIELTDKELSQQLRYIHIVSNVLADEFNPSLNRHILSSLISSMIYQNLVFVFKRLGTTVSETAPSRRTTYVREFLKLVHLNFTRERSVLFYAGKLCISPKYLSILVKESTGKSAAQWIDHFVIMEAKNLLRFSGKNVQQVAYALNFVNQSAFGKYFKHLTGMSPTEYQKNV